MHHIVSYLYNTLSFIPNQILEKVGQIYEKIRALRGFQVLLSSFKLGCKHLEISSTFFLRSELLVGWSKVRTLYVELLKDLRFLMNYTAFKKGI